MFRSISLISIRSHSPVPIREATQVQHHTLKAPNSLYEVFVNLLGHTYLTVKSRKEHSPLVRVKNLDYHHSSVLSALHVVHKSGDLSDIAKRSTNPIHYYHVCPIAVTCGLGVVNTISEITSKGSID